MRPSVRSFLLAGTSLATSGVRAQWCVPNTAIPYNANMPGVTRVVLNTIDRSSADIENYPYNSYVNTGLSTTLLAGGTYPMQVFFTLDAAIAPHMNVRVWVDLNHDGQLNDVGETLASADHITGSWSGTITIPLTSMLGATRMRVTAKMCSHGGHSLPTPCDMPADPLGYHGEIEDYDVNITDEVGITETSAAIVNAAVAPLPFGTSADLFVSLATSTTMAIELIDATGRVVSGKELQLPAGEHRIPLDGIGQLKSGHYFLRLTSPDGMRTLRVMKLE